MEFIVNIVTARPLITCMLIGVIWMSVWWLKFQKRLNIKWYVAPILSVIIFAVETASTELWALLEVGFDVDRAANRRIYGAIFIVPLVSYLVAKITKRDTALVLDMMTVSALISGIAVRINCLVQGCCDGVPITSDSTFRWPLVEMEMLLDLILVIYWWNRIYKRKTNGLAYPRFVLIYGVFRFVIEWAREEYTAAFWIFHMAHIWSLLAIVGSIVAIYLVNKRNTKEKHKSKHKRLLKGG